MFEAIIMGMKQIEQFRWSSQPAIAVANNLRSLDTQEIILVRKYVDMKPKYFGKKH